MHCQQQQWQRIWTIGLIESISKAMLNEVTENSAIM